MVQDFKDKTMRLRSHLIAALLVLCCTLALPCAADVLKITIDGPIHPIAEEYIARAITAAEHRHSEALLIELRTPGGLVDSTREIVEKILASRVPVIVYVAPSGARAASAGFFILESADVAAMAPGTNTGASHPVSIMGGKMDEVMKTKIENDTAAFLRSYVSKRGRNVQLAESAVLKSTSWTDQEALSQHLIDLVAPNEQELLHQLDGRVVKRFDGSSVTLHLAGQPVDDFPMSLRQRILGWLMDPNISFLLLAVGAFAIYAEMNHPGAVVPGVVGVIFILLAVFALNLLPTRFAAVTLILAAFVLFALGGQICHPRSARDRRNRGPDPGRIVPGRRPDSRIAGSSVDGARSQRAAGRDHGFSDEPRHQGAAEQSHHRVARSHRGNRDRADRLSPVGTVFVHGELWRARSRQPVANGEQVRVTGVNGLQLEVEPFAEPTAHADGSRSALRAGVS